MFNLGRASYHGCLLFGNHRDCSAIMGKFPNLMYLRHHLRPQIPQIRGFARRGCYSAAGPG